MTSNLPAIDSLGLIKAQIADLEAQEKVLRDQIAELGAGAYDGDLFRASVSIADRETIDWRAIAEKLEPSRQLITAHTSAKTVTTVRVAARK